MKERHTARNNLLSRDRRSLVSTISAISVMLFLTTSCRRVDRTPTEPDSSGAPVAVAPKVITTAGGLEMVLHCDIRFAANDARLGQPEINIGYIPPVGATQALARLLGRPRALKYLYDGTLVSAEEALALGLVDIIHSPERLHEKVQTYAETLTQKPAKALSAIRRTIIQGGGMSFDEGLKLEFETAVNLAGTKDFREGICAFLDKRKPQWE